MMIKIKVLATLFSMLFLLSSVNPKIEKMEQPKSKKVTFINIIELKQDSLQMKINRALIDEKASFENRIASSHEIREEILK